MIIFTHRGLEPSKNNFYAESSYQAFEDQIKRGFGIEFDANFAKDGMIVFHDPSLTRITKGKDTRLFSNLSIEEIKKILYDKKQSRISTFEEILEIIAKSKPKLHALHLKGKYQNKEKIDRLIEELKKFPKAIPKILIFDLKIESAEYIKSKIPEIKLAPSVAKEYDIIRYNQFVSNTLIPLENVLRLNNVYNWVWLDEWDTLDKDNKHVLFYTNKIFNELRKVGYKIVLVTPELHGTSPGLYGSEFHEDSKNKDNLFKRITEIIKLKPDAICTDYPEEVKEIVDNLSK